MSTAYDAIIIGTGQAGPPLAARLAEVGMNVAIVERKLFGGTCVNTGCIPTKAMVESAHAAYTARRGTEFGFASGPAVMDMKRVKARKDEASARSRNGLEAWLKGMKNCTVYEGQARLTSPREVRVDGETLTSGQIFINVGARAKIPAIAGLEQVPYLTNSSMIAVDSLPRHLMILGGSYIGLEFGQMFRRFGSEVTIIELGPRLIAREDEDVSKAIREILEGEGVKVRLNANCVSLARRGEEIVARVDCEGGGEEICGSHLLVAVGRRPNTDDLGLDAAGVTVDEHAYIAVDDQLRTNVPGIWALGDCNGKGAFTHTSYNDFEIVASNLLDKGQRRVSDRIPTYALYIDPALGRAGMTEAEVRATGKPALRAKRPMSRVTRAALKGDTRGFMKVVADAETKLILGAAILGPNGDEIIHSVLDVMYAGKPYTLIERAMHIHPTVSELIPTMLESMEPM
ncbi:MAG TPA: FAD-containing oxidoreductase [Bryobacteraceae bacterium]|jgi:pyruvate/2-oxoglutarate dehydrogenase complex dihydrolipoamide dehydrogenase (E3) component